MQLRTLFSPQLLFWGMLIYLVFSVPKRKLGDAIGDTFPSVFFVFRHLRPRNQLQIRNTVGDTQLAPTFVLIYCFFLLFCLGQNKEINYKASGAFSTKLRPSLGEIPKQTTRSCKNVGKLRKNVAISDLFAWPGFCQSFTLGIRLPPPPGHEISEWCQSAFAFLPSFFSKCCRSLRPLVRFEWPQSGLLGRTLKTPLEQLSASSPWELPTFFHGR